ncbi:DNA polymerase III subunit alpha [Emcibacter sp. SYSU 3D8]|uniref:DNA polymerase III subunit alpha n=1 Tax=Emcibacter sp. SYSU 3D8 TaxID=3133969 RepID=UPI0031FEF56C
MADFIHLRVHSSYSLSEGAIHLKALTKLCAAHRMPAMAVTDTGNLFGALEQSVLMAEAGVQPIIGCIVRVSYAQAVLGQQPPEPAQVVLLVQSETGYRNLIKLVSRSFMETDATSEPRVSLEDLLAANEGLLLLTGGPDGPIGRLVQQNQPAAAEALAQRIAGVFAGRTYVEIQRHMQDDEQRTEAAFLDIAYKLDLPLVATNDVFFARREMYEAHDALLCIATGAYVGQTDRRRVTPEHYFKSAEEMKVLFADLPEAIDNTVTIARRCAFMVSTHKPILPKFSRDGDEVEELRAQARQGLELRLEQAVYGDGLDEAAKSEVARPYRERLEFELDVIVNMGFPGYFLIVSDFIKWAKEHDVPVGPGRGSGAGSVAAWSLQITDLDPLRFGLLFERFLNPERVSMPDFDIDFCQEKRGQVISYVQEKYGFDQVAQIITFGKLQARAALRDVGRVLEMPYGQVDRLCRMVPNNPAKPVTLAEAIEGEPRLQAERDGDESVAHLLETALKLEGLYRNASTHAAGVVIGDRPLDELVPLYRDPRSPMPVTQFNMKWVEPAGLVKFDFLGLKTLTVIERSVRLIRRRGIDIDIARLPLDDEKTFRMLSKGDAAGIFQLESSGMRDVLKNMRPDSFEDIIALVALYRPGPMDNIPTYIKRKHGEETPTYMHDWLKPVLEETYGVIIYQEQVMQIAQILAGYSLGQADLLRRAMGKKKQEEMDAQRASFVQGATAKGVDPEQASFIFNLVDKFAGYGFNKSHAAAYALVAYQTAWLKANYPVEFLAASMTLDAGNTDKLNMFRRELERLSIPLLPPDINRSGVEFEVEAVEGEQFGVRYALAAIRNVGAQAMHTVVDERDKAGPFADLGDLSRRIDPRQVNKRQLENLVRAGAFDSLNTNRAQSYEAAETILRHAAAAANDRTSNQAALFGGTGGGETVALKLPVVRDWSTMEKLSNEFDAVGFFLTAHPLDAYKRALKQQNVMTWLEAFAQMQRGMTGFRLAGVIARVQERKSQKGKPYAFVELSDSSGAFEVMFFSQQLLSHRELLVVNKSVVLTVEARMENDAPKLVANGVQTIDEVAAAAGMGLRIVIDSDKPFDVVRDILEQGGRGKGLVHVTLKLPEMSRQVELTLPDRYKISPRLRDSLETVPGILEVQEI